MITVNARVSIEVRIERDLKVPSLALCRFYGGARCVDRFWYEKFEAWLYDGLGPLLDETCHAVVLSGTVTAVRDDEIAVFLDLGRGIWVDPGAVALNCQMIGPMFLVCEVQ